MAKFEQEIQKLEEQGIISKVVADSIRHYYASNEDEDQETNRLLLAFGILGALLIGLGIILIIAHNWDIFGKGTRLIIAFTPLVIAQTLVFYTRKKKTGNTAWIEVSAILLVLAIGACISMVSQIYNIEGELGSFLFTWCLLVLPIPYLTNSNLSSLLFIGIITWLGIETAYNNFKSFESFSYWILLLLIFPFYYNLYRKQAKSNAFNFHSWAIALSTLVMLGSWADNVEELLFVAYMALLSIYYWIGESDFFKQKKTISNAYRVISHIGIIGLCLSFTFDDSIKELWLNADPFYKIEFWLATTLIIVNLLLALQSFPKRHYSLIGYMGIIFAFIFFLIHRDTFLAVALMNILVLGIGIQEIILGNEKKSLAKINLGLIVISFLIFARFMDTDMSFVVRGILFLVVGTGFFLANYLFLKKRKTKS